MTLLVTAVTGDGIVLGADSAITTARPVGEPDVLTGFEKIIHVDHLHAAISIAGDAEIGRPGSSSWMSSWLRSFAVDASKAPSVVDLAHDLAGALNDPRVGAGDHILHVAGWFSHVDDPGNRLPFVAVVSKKSEDRYTAESALDSGFYEELARWRPGTIGGSYPLRLFVSGVLTEYASWMVRVATPEFARILKAPVPFAETGAVAEYIRFLIRSGAELYRVARRPAFVAEPIVTAILFRESKNMFTVRF